MSEPGAMRLLNDALRTAVVMDEVTAEYPLHVRYTKKGDTTHFKHRTQETINYDSAQAALHYCLTHPEVRIACMFDAKGRPVK